MTESANGSVRPGVTVGPATEFSLFFRVRAGQGADLRRALQDLQNHPGYRPGEYNMPIATIHEARFVLFDDDTRLLFATSFDGSWDAYMDDFFTSGPTLALFDAIFRTSRAMTACLTWGGEGLRPRARRRPPPPTRETTAARSRRFARRSA